MSLYSLSIVPISGKGMRVGPLLFGERATVILGRNGAGKTVLVSSLAFALGYPIEFPPLIRSSCKSVVLTFRTRSGLASIERGLDTSSTALVIEDDGTSRTLENERQIAEWVELTLGIAPRQFVHSNGQLTPSYMGISGPAFMIHQDSGWTNYYVPLEHQKFVKDQRVEVARWMLGLQNLNKAVDKRDVERAQLVQESLLAHIGKKRALLERLIGEFPEGINEDDERKMLARRRDLESEFTDAHSIVQDISSGADSINAELGQARSSLDALESELSSLRRRRAQLSDVQREVEVELGALGENEIAASAFRTYCANASCRFFRSPEESYGRRLLYLKDQLQGFHAEQGFVDTELRTLSLRVEGLRQSHEALVAANVAKLEQLGAVSAIALLRVKQRELAEIGIKLSKWQQVKNERNALNDLLEQERQATEQLASLRPRSGERRDALREFDVRKKLAENFRSWLKTLGTSNTGDVVDVDERLRPIVNDEIFRQGSSQSGSTRTRIVLAFHAAVLETSLSMGGSHPRMLMMDSPKQHELDAGDLRAGLTRLLDLSSGRAPVQVIFSLTDSEVIAGFDADSIWSPEFTYEDKKWFLERVGESPSPAEPARAQV